MDAVIAPFESRGYRPELNGQWVTWDAVRKSANSKKELGSIDVVVVPPQK